MWLLGARRQSRRQSRHSRGSSQQSLRRREACKGFGRARRQSRNRKINSEAEQRRASGSGAGAWLLGARRQSRRQSRHSRRSSQQSLRRRGFGGPGGSLGTVRKSFEQSPARDGSAKPEAQGSLQSFWEP